MFHSDPYLDPYSATIAPAGTVLAGMGPWVPEHFRLTLPDDGRLTDQWPFYATGERHAAYRDKRTTPRQKAASGGTAFLLQAEVSTSDADGGPAAAAARAAARGDGLVAFKDCNIYGNLPAGQVCKCSSAICDWEME